VALDYPQTQAIFSEQTVVGHPFFYCRIFIFAWIGRNLFYAFVAFYAASILSYTYKT